LSSPESLLNQFFPAYPGKPVPEKSSSGLYGAREDKQEDTLTIRLGTTPSRLISAHHHPPIFTQDALPTATIPLYPGLGLELNMLDCIPSGLVLNIL